MLADSLIALIRTAVPAVVGTILALLIHAGLPLDPGVEQSVSAALIPVCIAAYYALATLLERKYGRAWGWLLGSPNAPTYQKSDQSPAITAPADEIGGAGDGISAEG